MVMFGGEGGGMTFSHTWLHTHAHAHTNTNTHTHRLTEVDGEGAPLLAASEKVGALNMEIACAHCLRAQTVEQCHLRAR